MSVRRVGTAIMQPKRIRRSLTLTRFFTKECTRAASMAKSRQAGNAGTTPMEIPAALAEPSVETPQPSAMAVGSHAAGEPVSNTSARATAMITPTTRASGSATAKNIRRMRAPRVRGTAACLSLLRALTREATRAAAGVACVWRGLREVGLVFLLMMENTLPRPARGSRVARRATPVFYSLYIRMKKRLRLGRGGNRARSFRSEYVLKIRHRLLSDCYHHDGELLRIDQELLWRLARPSSRRYCYLSLITSRSQIRKPTGRNVTLRAW